MGGGIGFLAVLLFSSICAIGSLAFLVHGLWPKKPLNIKETFQKEKERTGVLWLLTPLLKKMAKRISKIQNDKLEAYRDKLDRDLVSAGTPANMDCDEFIALQLVTGVGVAVVGSILVLLVPQISSFITNPLIAPITVLLLFLAGVALARRGLSDRIAARHKAVFRALPFCLDLVTVSVEAGMDFISAVDKVVDRMNQGPLAEELYLMLRQIRMGKTRAESLKAMAERVNFFHLTTIISALVQADRLGTGLGAILRIQSQELRRKRSQIAEELAMKAPVKMLFPLIGFIFPAVFIMLFGPIVLSLLNTPGLM